MEDRFPRGLLLFFLYVHCTKNATLPSSLPLPSPSPIAISVAIAKCFIRCCWLSLVCIYVYALKANTVPFVLAAIFYFILPFFSSCLSYLPDLCNSLLPYTVLTAVSVKLHVRGTGYLHCWVFHQAYILDVPTAPLEHQHDLNAR